VRWPWRRRRSPQARLGGSSGPPGQSAGLGPAAQWFTPALPPVADLPAPIPTPVAAPVTAAPATPAFATPAPHGGSAEPAVRLVFTDGTTLSFDAGSSRARAFQLVADAIVGGRA